MKVFAIMALVGVAQSISCKISMTTYTTKDCTGTESMSVMIDYGAKGCTVSGEASYKVKACAFTGMTMGYYSTKDCTGAETT